MTQTQTNHTGAIMQNIELLNRVLNRAEIILLQPQQQYPWNDIVQGAKVARPDGCYKKWAAVERNTFRGFHKIDKQGQGSGDVFKNYLVSNRDTLIAGLKAVQSADDLHLLENKLCAEIKPRLTNIKPLMLTSFNKIRKPLDLYIEHLVTMAEELAADRQRLVSCLFLPLDSQMFQQVDLFSEQELRSVGISRRSTYTDVKTEMAYQVLQKKLKVKAEQISTELGKPFHPIYFDLLWNGRVDRWGSNLFETNP